MNIELHNLQESLGSHSIYQHLTSLPAIRQFMEGHVFAVWDFMSLLKSLQRQVTCVEVPWRPSIYPAELVRLINEIVVAEESDRDQRGEVTSHFQMYLQAMEEVGANVGPIRFYLETFDEKYIPTEVAEFVSFNLQLAQSDRLHEIAAAFFYGREKLIPDLFTPMIKVLRKHGVEAPSLLYYLERHIELDGEDHGPMGKRFLEILCDNDPAKWQEALMVAKHSLQLRHKLWNSLESKICQKSSVSLGDSFTLSLQSSHLP